MARQMATLRNIDDITPHHNADALEIAKVGGWNVVVRLDEFQKGDAVVYFEIDSALPLDDERFAFLAPRGSKTINGREYHVLKTAKLRGVISQGLILPARLFPELNRPVREGANWYDAIGIAKYEPPIPAHLSGQMVGAYPQHGHFLKTDAERVQNLSDIWGEIQRHEWIATEKLDGSSVTFLVEDDQMRVASRNWELVWNDNLASVAYAVRHHLADEVGPGYQIQGELVGPGIQRKAPISKHLTDVAFFVFGVFKDYEPIPRAEWPKWCLDRAVPILDISLPDTIEATVTAAEGLTSVVAPGRQAEGIVFATVDPLDSLGGRTVFKSINNKYLLKYED